MNNTTVNKKHLLNILRCRLYEYSLPIIEERSYSFSNLVNFIDEFNSIRNEIIKIENLNIGDTIDVSSWVYKDLDYMEEYDFDCYYYVNDEDTVNLDLNTLQTILTQTIATLN